MGITDSILEARKRGASDDLILQKISQQNPEKAPVIETAKKRGASSTLVLDEFIRQNPVVSSIDASGKPTLTRLKDTLGTIIKSRFDQIGETFKAQSRGELGGAESGLQYTGSIAGGIGDIVGVGVIEAGKAILPQKAEEAVEKMAMEGAKAVHLPEIAAKYDEWKAKNPRIAKDLESVVNIASLFPIGGGARIAGKTAAEVAGTTAKLAGEATETAGRLIKGAGEVGIQKAITPTVQEAERILSYEAKSPLLTRIVNTATGTIDESKPVTRAATAAEKGIMGTERMVGVQSKRTADTLWRETINPAVKASNAIVSKEELFKPIAERISSTLEPGKHLAYEDAFSAIQDDYKNITSFTLEQAQKVKRELDEFTPDKIFKGKSVTNEYATLKNDMANAIRQKTYEALKEKRIKKDYLDWANLHELERVGVRAITSGAKKGGFGGFWSSMWDSFAIPIETIGGQILYRVGNKLEFIGDKGITTFGDFLKSKGFHQK